MAGNSAALVSSLDSQVEAHGTWLNTQPFYVVSSGVPLSSISVQAGCNGFVGSTAGEVPSAGIPVPSYVTLNGSSDSPLDIVSPSTGLAYELWQANRTSSGYSACWGGSMPLATSDGVVANNYGLSATSISYTATAISEEDVEAGAITHAIALELSDCTSFVAPATRGDCSTSGSYPAEGQWFRFAPGTTCGSCTAPLAKMIFQAGLEYGFVVTDQTDGNVVAMVMEQSSDWAAEGNSGTDPITSAEDGKGQGGILSELPWSDLQVVTPPAG